MDITLRLSDPLQRSVDRMLDIADKAVVQLTVWPDGVTVERGTGTEISTPSEVVESVPRTGTPAVAPAGAPETAAPEAKTPEAKAPEAENLTPTPFDAPAVPGYTDVRAAIDAVRARIIGADWEEQKEADTERYRRYGRPIMAQCREIARHLGAAKVQAIPEEMRAQAIGLIGTIGLDADGELVPLILS